MTENMEKGSAQSGPGSADQNQNSSGSADDGTISKEAFKRLQADLYKVKEENKSLVKTAEDYKQKEITATGNWKEQYESEKQKRLESDKKIAEFSGDRKKAALLAEVKRELNTLGLDSAKETIALKLVSDQLAGVIVDEETGTVLGADRVAKKFFDQYQDLNIWKQTQGKIDQRAAGSNGARTLDKMSQEERLKIAFAKMK